MKKRNRVVTFAGAVISKRDQLAVALESGRLEISYVDHDELATVAKGLIQPTV